MEHLNVNPPQCIWDSDINGRYNLVNHLPQIPTMLDGTADYRGTMAQILEQRLKAGESIVPIKYIKTAQGRVTIEYEYQKYAKNLRELFINNIPLKDQPLSIALKVIQGLSSAVHEYNSLGLIHKDVKPSNFLLVPENEDIQTCVSEGRFKVKLNDHKVSILKHVWSLQIFKDRERPNIIKNNNIGKPIGTEGYANSIQYSDADRLHYIYDIKNPNFSILDTYSLGISLAVLFFYDAFNFQIDSNKDIVIKSSFLSLSKTSITTPYDSQEVYQLILDNIAKRYLNIIITGNDMNSKVAEGWLDMYKLYYYNLPYHPEVLPDTSKHIQIFTHLDSTTPRVNLTNPLQVGAIFSNAYLKIRGYYES